MAESLNPRGGEGRQRSKSIDDILADNSKVGGLIEASYSYFIH